MIAETRKTGWKLVKFGDVVKNANLAERNPKVAGIERIVGLEHLDPENLHVRRWNTLENGTSFSRKFVPGQTLFGKRRAYQRKVAFAEFEGICSGDILTFEPKDLDVLLPELLPFICQTDAFFNHALGTSAGSLSPRTSYKALQDFEFPLPPIEEQKRIAEILWAADEAVERYASVYSAVESSRTALLNSLMSEEYPLVQLGKLLRYASDGPFGSRLKTEHYSESGARVVRLQNIEVLRFNDSDKSFISTNYYEQLRRYALFPGDILVAGLGDDAHPVGRACLVPEWLGPAINKADCFCIRPDKDTVLPEFLSYFLNSVYARKEIMRVTQGTTRYRINVSNLKTIRVSVPSKGVQQRFVREMHDVDLAEQTLSAHTKETSDIRRVLGLNLLKNGTAYV